MAPSKASGGVPSSFWLVVAIVIPEKEAIVSFLDGDGVWGLTMTRVFPFDMLDCGAGVVLGLDILHAGVALTGVASNVLGSAGVLEICRNDRVFMIDLRMVVLVFCQQ